MKFTVKSNSKGSVNCGANAQSVSAGKFATKMAKLLRGKDTEVSPSEKEHYDNNGAVNIRWDYEISSEVNCEMDVDELKELSIFYKEQFNLNKESCEYTWHKIKEMVDDSITFLKEKGKDVVNAIYDIIDESEKRNDYYSRESLDKTRNKKDPVMEAVKEKTDN